LRAYEAVVVLAPSLDEDRIQAFLQRATEAVEQKGGQVTAVERWGKRRLAYEIRDQREGHYVLLRLRAEPVGGTAELAHLCRISDDVLRHLIVLEQEGAAASPKAEPAKGETNADGARPEAAPAGEGSAAGTGGGLRRPGAEA
jgi:small subunit ribosomal protein S6